VCGPEAGIFVEVLQKGEIINATLYLQTIQKLRHAVPEKHPKHRKSSCYTTGHGPTFFACAWREFMRTAGDIFPIHPPFGPSLLELIVCSVCCNGSDEKPATFDF
jgi:hypothetical protein